MSGGNISGTGSANPNTAASGGDSLYNSTGTAQWGDNSNIIASGAYTDGTITGGSPGSITGSVSLQPLIDPLAAGSRVTPTVLTLNGGTYTITNSTTISLTSKHIHLKVPAGQTATIQVTQNLPNEAFNLLGATLVLGETSGGGTLKIDGGNTSGITNNGSLIYVGANSYLEINSGVTLRNNTNSHTTSEGGAVFITDSLDASGTESSIKITGGTISGNSAKNGGAIFMYAYTYLEMTGGIIENNSASNWGGGIATWNGSSQEVVGSWPIIEISGGEIRNNQATATDGGEGNGGGILSHATTTISGTAKIHDNHAGGIGGGICRYNSANVNNTLTFDGGNSATYVYDNTATGGSPQVANP
jgi:hypothetical protein